ncbi:hypothetical protein BCV70DRAFT_98886 [Testicularia cyperi]|uniref:Uncharacterized protein n=1 Tax=Testicularia cyperi TaxID=1882483 RepID=A0A317XQR2_9BASI|nr:hypothetical protein BCV70DRAFT_98886 [Testicularia cyperi]
MRLFDPHPDRGHALGMMCIVPISLIFLGLIALAFQPAQAELENFDKISWEELLQRANNAIHSSASSSTSSSTVTAAEPIYFDFFDPERDRHLESAVEGIRRLRLKAKGKEQLIRPFSFQPNIAADQFGSLALDTFSPHRSGTALFYQLTPDIYLTLINSKNPLYRELTLEREFHQHRFLLAWHKTDVVEQNTPGSVFRLLGTISFPNVPERVALTNHLPASSGLMFKYSRSGVAHDARTFFVRDTMVRSTIRQ